MVVSRIFGSIFGQSRPSSTTGASAAVGAPAPLSDDARVVKALDDQLVQVRGAGRLLPTLISSQLRQLDDLLRPLVQYVALSGASTEQRVLLEAMIVDYIGSPLSTYLSINDAERSDHARSTVLFANQLNVLFTTVKDLDNQIRSGAITELSTHSRFLEDKFGTSSLTLDRGND